MDEEKRAADQDPVYGTSDGQLELIAAQKQVIFAEMVLRAQLWKEYLSADPWYANWTNEDWRRYAAGAVNELPPGSEERYCLLAQHRRRSAPPSPFDADQRDGWPLMADFPQTQAGFDDFMGTWAARCRQAWGPSDVPRSAFKEHRDARMLAQLHGWSTKPWDFEYRQ